MEQLLLDIPWLSNEVYRDNSVKIRYHPGATTDDIIDYVRPTARKKPDTIIIHTGTNDIQNKVNTLQKVRKAITTIKELMLTIKYKFIFQVTLTAMIKTLRKKSKKSTESWRIFVRVKRLSSLIIIIIIIISLVHVLIEANYT